MPSERGVRRSVPLATPFGRLARERGSTRGVILSAGVHLAVLLALLWAGSRLVVADRAPGPGHGLGGGGGGGGNPRILLYAPPDAPAPAPLPQQVSVPVVPTMPVPAVRLPEARVEPIAPPVMAAALGPGSGAGSGAGKGPGAGTGSGGGSGSGVGPGIGSDSGGGGGRIYPPQPQTIVIPPADRPRSVRGTTVTAVFEISARGDVTHVSLDPMPRDRKFANAFLAKLRGYAFTPAYTLDGRPIAAIYRISFVL